MRFDRIDGRKTALNDGRWWKIWRLPPKVLHAAAYRDPMNADLYANYLWGLREGQDGGFKVGLIAGCIASSAFLVAISFLIWAASR